MATFLLVHGTFAKVAHWPALQEGLAEEANEAGETACFRQLPWSGKNRASARQAAASAILRSVQDVQSNSNSERIFLIGHSHGGSAIAYFLKEHTEIAKTLSGCAFLSTPFVAMRPRDQAALIITTVSLVAMMVGGYFWSRISFMEWPWSALSYAALCICFFIVVIYGPRKSVEQTIRQQTADIPAGNYFFIRYSGDEAAALLSALQFINWVNMKASKILLLLIRGKRSVVVIPLMMIVPLLLQVILIPKLRAFGLEDLFKHLLHEPSVKSTAEFLLLFAVFTLSCLAVLCLLVAFFIFLVQAVTTAAFGWTRLATGFWVELAVEPLPFGTYSLVHLDWNVGSEKFAHSWTYAHPDAIRHLRDWVKASLLSAPAHHPPSPLRQTR